MNYFDNRLIHFDLKGAIPKLSFIEKILPIVSSWGATGILLEYEDAFPFTGNLSHLQSPSAFSVEDVSKILSLCESNNLKIVPLIQSFGHFEFVLKHDSFRHLREVDAYPNALCPFHPGAPGLVMSLIESIVEAHSAQSNYLHIGADEVWHIGKCPRCVSEMHSRNWDVTDLFLHFVSSIAKRIKKKFPNLKLIMWDDMMRRASAAKLNEYGMGELVEPMIWKYEKDNFNLPPEMFDTFSSVFDGIWIASCFKGATGSTQFLPPIQHHIDNQLTWLSVMKDQHTKFKFIRGIALTGWQRYDHYAVLCELLPVSIPSLALCLRVLKNESFRQEDHEAVSRELGFRDLINVVPFPRPQILEQDMTFPGHEMYTAVQIWSNLVHKYRTICNSEGMLGWFSEHFRSRNFTNPAQVETILFQLLEVESNFSDLQGHMTQCLLEIYFEDTVEEWIGCYFKPLLLKLKTIIEECKYQIEIGGRTRDYQPAKTQTFLTDS